jgi:hypothetical protein
MDVFYDYNVNIPILQLRKDHREQQQKANDEQRSLLLKRGVHRRNEFKEHIQDVAGTEPVKC